jgi:hypothetical protein
MKQLIETVENLRVCGIGFRSLTEALDTTTAQGRLVFHMFGALAEFERSLIRERTQAGLAAARRAGRTGGRPPKLTEDDLEAARIARQSRYWCHPNRAPSRRFAGDALSLHLRRANREYPGRLKNGALPLRPDSPGTFSPGSAGDLPWHHLVLTGEIQCHDLPHGSPVSQPW